MRQESESSFHNKVGNTRRIDDAARIAVASAPVDSSFESNRRKNCASRSFAGALVI
jgi:hypothetical protein